MKGSEAQDADSLSAQEGERLDARYRAFVEAAGTLRGLAGAEVEPCWATELELQP